MPPNEPHQTDLPFAERSFAVRRPPPATRRELQVRAAALAGHSVAQLAGALGAGLPADARRAKGFVGQLVERALGADPAAGDHPDFPQLGVELKTIPMGARGHPAGSTFVCAITMDAVDRERWESSRLRHKLACVLWVPVDDARVAPLGERRFGAPRLWEPSEDEAAVLRADWEDLIGAIASGRPITAHDGKCLQLRPKAADSTVRTLSATNDGAEMAAPLGFYLRATFTAEILAGGR